MTGFIASAFLSRNRVSLKEAFEGLELCERKRSCTVLRGLDGSNPVRLLGLSGRSNMAARSENLQPLVPGQPWASGLQRHSVTDPHFPGSKNRRIDARALFVLLGNAAKNRGTRLCARRIERDHHATQVAFRDGNPRWGSHAKNPARPLQHIEGIETLKSDQQVRANPHRVFPSLAFLRDSSYRLSAD